MIARGTTRSNQRPDTLMQDRKADRSMKPLATHGRTIHGSFATDRCAMKIGPCPQCPESDGWRSRGRPSRWAASGHSRRCNDLNVTVASFAVATVDADRYWPVEYTPASARFTLGY